MNSVNLIGRLADNPVVRSKRKQTWARFPIAIQKNEKEVSYFTIVAFDQTAEFIEKYFAKGNRIGITGYLNQSKYTDNNGENKYSVEIIANRAYFADGKREEYESRNNKRGGK